MGHIFKGPTDPYHCCQAVHTSTLPWVIHTSLLASCPPLPIPVSAEFNWENSNTGRQKRTFLGCSPGCFISTLLLTHPFSSFPHGLAFHPPSEKQCAFSLHMVTTMSFITLLHKQWPEPLRPPDSSLRSYQSQYGKKKKNKPYCPKWGQVFFLSLGILWLPCGHLGGEVVMATKFIAQCIVLTKTVAMVMEQLTTSSRETRRSLTCYACHYTILLTCSRKGSGKC